ncbi:hypothetical protein [Streptomyces sp. NPDC002537]
MNGPGLAPPPRRPNRAAVITIRVVVIVLTVGAAGVFCWVAMLRLAIMRRRARDWALFWATLVTSVVLLAAMGSFPEGHAGRNATLAALLLLTAAALTHYIRSDIRFQRELARSAAPAGPVPGPLPIEIPGTMTGPAPGAYGGYGYPQPQPQPHSHPQSQLPPPSGFPQHPHLPPQTPPRPYAHPQPHPQPYAQAPAPDLHHHLTQPQQQVRPGDLAPHQYRTPPPRPPAAPRGRHARPQPAPESAHATTVDQAPPVPRQPGPPQPPPQPLGHHSSQPRPARPQRIDQVRAELDELSDLLRKEPRDRREGGQ